MATEVDLSFFDRIGKSGIVNNRNTTDTYRFGVGFGGNFRFTLNPNSSSNRGNADVRLVRDINNDGEVSSNEVIATSEKVGSNESLSEFLVPGDNYYLQVYAKDDSNPYKFTASLN